MRQPLKLWPLLKKLLALVCFRTGAGDWGGHSCGQRSCMALGNMALLAKINIVLQYMPFLTSCAQGYMLFLPTSSLPNLTPLSLPKTLQK